MKDPGKLSSIATFSAENQQTRMALNSGMAFSGVAHFPDGQHPDSSVIMKKYYGVDTMVSIELLTGGVLLCNILFEIRAGKQVLGIGRIRCQPNLGYDTPIDKPAPKILINNESVRVGHIR